jgi:hypothetical protein
VKIFDHNERDGFYKDLECIFIQVWRCLKNILLEISMLMSYGKTLLNYHMEQQFTWN